MSLKDGSDSYKCEANELTVILTTDCTIHFETNGGSPMKPRKVRKNSKLKRLVPPAKPGAIFNGWTKNPAGMIPW